MQGACVTDKHMTCTCIWVHNSIQGSFSIKTVHFLSIRPLRSFFFPFQNDEFTGKQRKLTERKQVNKLKGQWIKRPSYHSKKKGTNKGIRKFPGERQNILHSFESLSTLISSQWLDQLIILICQSNPSSLIREWPSFLHPNAEWGSLFRSCTLRWTCFSTY